MFSIIVPQIFNFLFSCQDNKNCHDIQCLYQIYKKKNYGLNKDESVKGGKLVEEHFCTRCTVKHGFLPLV